jgi:hypothetical protein
MMCWMWREEWRCWRTVRFSARGGADFRQNAWLILTIKYRLNFAVGYNDQAGLIVQNADNGYIALDLDKDCFRSWRGIKAQ